jgi:hypothetical protein
LAILKNGDFEKRPFWNLFLLHLYENQPKLLGYQGWVEILMITLVYSKRVSVRNNLLHSVPVIVKPNLNRKLSTSKDSYHKSLIGVLYVLSVG